MSRRSSNPHENMTTLRVRRKTARVVSTIARARETTADQLVWDMLEKLYPGEIELVEQLRKEDNDEAN